MCNFCEAGKRLRVSQGKVTLNALQWDRRNLNRLTLVPIRFQSSDGCEIPNDDNDNNKKIRWFLSVCKSIEASIGRGKKKKKKSNLKNSIPCVFTSSFLDYWLVLQCQDMQGYKNERRCRKYNSMLENLPVQTAREIKHEKYQDDHSKKMHN